MAKPIYDVAIVGAGMTGSAAAISLAQAGFSVCLIEANVFPQWKASAHSLRVSAISKASESLLEQVGVWSKIVQSRVSAYDHMHVWESDNKLEFDAADYGLPCLGYIVENNLINSSLIGQCEQDNRITLHPETRVDGLVWQDEKLELSLSNGERVSARLLIAADGGNSAIRRMAGIETSQYDYQQTGIVARVQTELSHSQTAWQRFTEIGPLALLPLSDGSCSIVWSVDKQEAGVLLQLNDDDFSQRLTMAYEGKLGKIRVLSKRAGFPLIFSNAKTYVNDRLVLLGDAAHRVHPLAGQGVNLGFQDVTELTATLSESVANGRDVADPLYLRRYARQRRAELGIMMSGMHTIQRVFTSSMKTAETARALTMNMINRTPFIKQILINRALGIID